MTASEHETNLNWRLRFVNRSVQKDFFEFTFDKRMSSLTICLSSCYIFVFFPIICSAFPFCDTSLELGLNIICSICCLLCGVSGLLISYFQYYGANQYRYESIPYLQALFIISASVFNILFASIRVFTDECDHIPAGKNYFYCAGIYDEKQIYYSVLTSAAFSPTMWIVCLREVRLEFIIGALLINAIVFGCLTYIEGHQDLYILFAVNFLFNAIICIDIQRSYISKFLQHKKLQKVLQDLERIQAEDRAAELRAMIGNVAHDLKTPLASYMTGMDLIADATQELEHQIVTKSIRMSDIKQSFENIKSCLQNARNTNSFMLMTINRCIDYTKASKGISLNPKCETIALKEVIELPLECMQNIQERIDVKLLPIPEEICPHIITDKQWLQENILCLLSNAVKYSNGGLVTIGCYLADEEYDINEDEKRYFLATGVLKMFSSRRIVSMEKRKPSRLSSSVLANHNSSSNANLQHTPSMTNPFAQHFAGKSKIIPLHYSFHVPAADESKSSSMRRDSLRKHTDNTRSEEKAHDSDVPTPSMNSSLQKFVFFEVIDQGIGLSDEVMKGLFNPFKQAQRLAGGTGLGLYSLARRIEAIKGKYGVRKRRDGKQGSVFWFAIPYRPDETMIDFDDTVPMKRRSYLEQINSIRRSTAEGNETSIHAISDDKYANVSRRYSIDSVNTFDGKDRSLPLQQDDLEADALNLYHAVVNKEDSNHSSVNTFPKQRRNSHITLLQVIDLDKPAEETAARGSPDQSPSKMKDKLSTDRSISSPLSAPSFISPMSSPGSPTLPIPPSIVWNILIADDSPMILKMISLMFRRLGHRISSVENGALAVDKIQQYFQLQDMYPSDFQREKDDLIPYDLILMDLQMPIMDGLEATKRIRALERKYLQINSNTIPLAAASTRHILSPVSNIPKKIKIIGMSANSDDQTMQEALIAGVNAFLPKPFTMELFTQCIAGMETTSLSSST